MKACVGSVNEAKLLEIQHGLRYYCANFTVQLLLPSKVEGLLVLPTSMSK